MRVVKPDWVRHGPGSPIYSVDIQPSKNSERFATGGLDCQIRIWAMKHLRTTKGASVAVEERDLLQADPLLLCTLTNHQGPINSVRWSPDGLMLASGSDDYTVMLWKLTPGTPRRGNLEAQQAIEPWRCVQCFREAKQNVLDVAWSADGKRLASCSIDNNIYIWNMSTNALEATLVGHNGPVKGLCWDPVGKYLASQGADKKLQIWHADTWKKDDAVTEPFANMVGMEALMFNRIAWSADGQTIVTSNSENGGFHVAACVLRKNDQEPFAKKDDFVGHQKPVTCARANQRIFEKQLDGNKHKLVTRVAVGSNDSSLSIWETQEKRPMIVVHELFEPDRGVMDMSWSSNGLELLACSQEGSVAFLSFSAKEMGRAIPPSEKATLYRKLYGAPQSDAVIAETPVQLNFENSAAETKRKRAMQNGAAAAAAAAKPLVKPRELTTTFSSGSYATDLKTQRLHVPGQQESRTSEGKRRITPQLLSGGSGARQAPMVSHPAMAPLVEVQRRDSTSAASAAAPSPVHRASTSSISDRPSTSAGKRRRTTGGGSSRNMASAALPPALTPAPAPVVIQAPSLYSELKPLRLPPDLKLSAEMSPKSWVVTTNGRSNTEEHKLACIHDGAAKWSTLLSERATALAANKSIVVVAGEAGSVSTFTPCGKRLLPPLMTGAPLSLLRIKEMDVIALTSARLLYVWRLDKLTVIHAGIDLSPILTAKLGGDVMDITLTGDGTPVVTMSAGGAALHGFRAPSRVYAYHAALKAWLEVGNAESKAFQRSDFHSNLASTGVHPSDGPLAAAQSVLHGLQGLTPQDTAAALLAAGPEAQMSASRDHVYYQLAAAVALNSKDEFEHWLVCYARLLAKGGLTEELRKLCESLLMPSTDEPELAWPPLYRFKSLDLPELLRKCLAAVAAGNRSMQRFVVEYQETLSALEQAKAAA